MRLIDANALINTLQELFDKREKEARFTGDRGATVTWNDAIYHVKTAPTIEAEPVRHGRWIESTGYDGRDHYYRCSECGRYINLICGAKLSDYPYCHCGARMDGGKSDE